MHNRRVARRLNSAEFQALKVTVRDRVFAEEMAKGLQVSETAHQASRLIDVALQVPPPKAD